MDIYVSSLYVDRIFKMHDGWSNCLETSSAYSASNMLFYFSQIATLIYLVCISVFIYFQLKYNEKYFEKDKWDVIRETFSPKEMKWIV